MQYEPRILEKKWQQRWAQHPDAVARSYKDHQKKYYCLDMFPYPSGAGLHIGHCKSYTLSDIYARMKWLQGYNVLHPMGYDAFGLPAENDAIKKKLHPAAGTAHNIANFKRQLTELGALYDWTKEINTTDPEYYKWTQWIFIKMYNAGLAYRDNKPINWCPSCKTGLANEEVINGACERCGAIVTQKDIPQWVLRITRYAEPLLKELDNLNWPEKVKHMQRNWIGKSEGCVITFTTTDHHGEPIDLPVYTTRPDTIFGVTYLVLAPELKLVNDIVSPQQLDAVTAYRTQVNQMTPFQRQLDKDKTGVFSGAYATCPITKRQLPIYLASYILPDYGTGMIMAVPGHDERDFAFAQQFQLPIIQVIESSAAQRDQTGQLTQAYTGNGTLINSDILNGLSTTDALQKACELIEKLNVGKREVRYKLRDWIFSRQRYWGEPIPLIHCSVCGIVPVPEDQLPVVLPDVENYEPTGTGQSPLAAIESWVNVSCPHCGGAAKRETNTMPQWAGSCWYFLRYPNPHNSEHAWTPEEIAYWLPVDLYVGGIEHAILHLLYARFYTHVLADLGYLPFKEPFTQLFNQGMILKLSEKSGLVEKMSKSKGNVINPDDVIATSSVDALRMYVMFMGPPELDCEWQDNGLEGSKRFLARLWSYITNPQTLLSETEVEDKEISLRINRFFYEFCDRLENFKPNTAISASMELLNDLTGCNARISRAHAESILVCLSVFTPYISSELLESIFNKRLADCVWPTYDKQLVESAPVTVAIQINGKTRCTITVAKDTAQAELEKLAREQAAAWLADKQVIKTIVVPNRMVSFVIK